MSTIRSISSTSNGFYNLFILIHLNVALVYCIIGNCIFMVYFTIRVQVNRLGQRGLMSDSVTDLPSTLTCTGLFRYSRTGFQLNCRSWASPLTRLLYSLGKL